jgi:hypothetical protein
MKQNAGIFTAIAVVLAVFGLSSIPKGSPGGAGGSTPNKESARGARKSVRASTKNGSDFYSSCQEIQSRLDIFVAEQPHTDWRLPDYCYDPIPAATDPQFPTLTPKDMEFVIVTAPNPVSTHLALLFDRSVEIIEQAAQDNGYSYDSSWLPWNEGKEYARYSDQKASEDAQTEKDKQPGILVFRRLPKEGSTTPYDEGLAVFVVSEVPTGGIN